MEKNKMGKKWESTAFFTFDRNKAQHKFTGQRVVICTNGQAFAVDETGTKIFYRSGVMDNFVKGAAWKEWKEVNPSGQFGANV